jgi:hypothetical protein
MPSSRIVATSRSVSVSGSPPSVNITIALPRSTFCSS